MKEKFNSDEAKAFLLAKEEKEKMQREEVRKTVLQKVISTLVDEFKGSNVEIYLIGSILRPFSFSPSSDVDIVLKNYKGDRFELWSKLERKIERKVEIIYFEKCHFQEYVLKDGLKVI